MKHAEKPSRPARLRTWLREPGAVLAPLIYDGVTAKMAETAGFRAVWLSGGSALGCSLGVCDSGLFTLTDVVRQTRTVTRTTNLCPIVGIDSGFGSARNVWRAVRELEAAGAAAISINDQVFPQSYPGRPDWGVVPESEAIARVRTASQARTNPDLIIMARTDHPDINEAIARANAFVDAGADFTRVIIGDMSGDTGQDKESGIAVVARVVQELKAPTNIAHTKSVTITVDQAERLGYKIIAFRVTAWSYTAIKRAWMNVSGGPVEAAPKPVKADEVWELIRRTTTEAAQVSRS